MPLVIAPIASPTFYRSQMHAGPARSDSFLLPTFGYWAQVVPTDRPLNRLLMAFNHLLIARPF